VHRDRTLVAGAFWGLPAELLAPFAASLQSTGFSGRLLILAAHLPPAEIDRLRELADEVEVVDPPSGLLTKATASLLKRLKLQRGLRRLYPRAFRLAVRLAPRGRRDAWWAKLELSLHGLQSLRYEGYAAYLDRRADEYDAVLIADVRDVIFQRTPFDPMPTGLEVFLEEPRTTLSSPGFNSSWGRDLYGPRWTEVGDGPVSCSGVTAGTATDVHRYCRTMAAEVRTARIGLGPRDQAIHNWLLRQGQLNPVEQVVNGSGRVFTVDQYVMPTLDERGLILNADGSVPAVVHQYDRHPSLAARIINRGSPS